MSLPETKRDPFVFPVSTSYAPETAELALFGYGAFLESLGSDAFSEFRKKSLAHVREKGLPTPKLERWKYTNLPAEIRDRAWVFGESGISWHGGAGADIRSLSDLLQDPEKDLLDRICVNPQDPDNLLFYLNGVWLRDGFVIDVPAGRVIEEPLKLVTKGRDGAFFSPRILVRLGAGAQMTLIERHEGGGAYWKNPVTRIDLEAGAVLRHYVLQDDSAQAVYTGTTDTRVERDCVYETLFLTAGAKLSRNQIHVDMLGENATCRVQGILLQADGQHGDTTIRIDHRMPHGRSEQSVRNVLTGHAHGVFQGKTFVSREAQKTDGYQKCETLLLSPLVEIDAKPELEIYADDVKCSHGVTTGQVDEDALFYLRSRGIPGAEARAMLVGAFLSGFVDPVPQESVREMFLNKVDLWLKMQMARS